MVDATPPPIDPDEAETVLPPEASGEGYWVGAPSVATTGSDTYLAVRKRTPRDRGHTLVIYEQAGPASYEPVAEIRAADMGVESIERPALLTDPDTGTLKLYLSVDHGAYDWTIQKLDDVSSPESFDPSTARVVLEPRPGTTDADTVKDPFVLNHGDRYYMFYAGYDGRSEQAHLATSPDGEAWTRVSANPVLGRQHWHDHHTRITCVVPAPDSPGWLVFYDGSGGEDYQNAWNLRTGVATTSDLTTFVDVTTTGPAYAARTTERTATGNGYATLRYLDVLARDGEWTVFFETARDDDAFELRQATVPLDG